MRRERRNFQGAAGDSVSNTAQPTKGKEIMGKRIEDLKETAPCGMLIHYTVNEEDMITYNDINGRGVHCDKCDGCTWKGICKPEEPKKAMSHKTYIEIYNLIDDAMQEAGEKVEEACNKLAKSDADPKCVNLSFLLLIGWFTLAMLLVNEARSILENLVECGYNIPDFLIKGLAVTQKS